MSDKRPSFDLRSVTPGWRSLSCLTGRAHSIWIDHRRGRLAARIAKVIGLDAHAVWQAPIGIRRARGAPLLSWRSVPLTVTRPDQFIALLNNFLSKPYRPSIPEDDLLSIMQRVRDVRALDPLDSSSAGLVSQPNGITVLLIDEREHNPQSALGRTARRQAFREMVASAVAAHPDATFSLGQSAHITRGKWLSSSAVDVFPSSLKRLNKGQALCASINQADHVYTVCAEEGMHALLARVPLHVFGTPYYAGWGFTRDARVFESRHARPTLARFFDAVFIHYTRYLDPATHRPGTLAALLDSIVIQREVGARFHELGPLTGIGFQWWKRPFATPYLSAGGHALRWTDDPASLDASECAVIWGGRDASGLRSETRQVRIEDGFIHSLGLGSDMIAPRSQVIDTRGLYFDASRPSDLTILLNETAFDAAELSRAASLRALIVRQGVTKYNLGRRRPTWQAPPDRRVVLVPGQVADDASIRLGTGAISTADALLREVRARRPDAWIVYKPHPDVMSGNRQGLLDAAALADVVDMESDLISLIEAAHEVHTLSSLSGFEALLRGKAVHTYGLPFYAGWGLTKDALAPIPWRERALSLDMLTAGVLLRYPLYWDWRLRLFTTPEHVVAELAPRAGRPLAPVYGDRLRLARKAFRWARNALSHLSWRLSAQSRKFLS